MLGESFFGYFEVDTWKPAVDVLHVHTERDTDKSLTDNHSYIIIMYPVDISHIHKLLQYICKNIILYPRRAGLCFNERDGTKIKST